jgi:hypothetical protein
MRLFKHYLILFLPILLIIESVMLYNPPRANAAATVTLGSAVTGRFFASNSTDQKFTATPNSTVANFTQTFPTLNFNAPSSEVPCSPINNNAGHFTNEAPQPDGSCQTVNASGNGLQAGAGTLSAFNAVFTGTFNVSGTGSVTFRIHSDDGWIIGMGPEVTNGTMQPTYVNDNLAIPPGCCSPTPPKTPFMNYNTIDSLNYQENADWNRWVTINFPAPGTYPYEIDYFEAINGTQLQFALLTGSSDPGTPIPGLPIGPTLYSISGYIYNDLNKDKHYNPPYPNPPETFLSGNNGTITVKDSGGTVVKTISPITSTYTTGKILSAGTYTVVYTYPPLGYNMSYPLGSPPSFTVKVGPGCAVNGANDAVCSP